jgi:hypothetical protein
VNVTPGTDTLTPGSLVLVISDDGEDDPAQSLFVGRLGIVSEVAGAGVIVPMDGHEYHFMPHELQAVTGDAKPGDCPQAHRYQIFQAALDVTSIVFESADRARVLYDALPEAAEPMWYVTHLDGTGCFRESQRQEVAGFPAE